MLIWALKQANLLCYNEADCAEYAEFSDPIVTRDDDNFFLDLIGEIEEDGGGGMTNPQVLLLASHWHRLSLDAEEVQPDLVLLTNNMASTRDDELTSNFAQGKSLDVLFELLCYSIGPLASCGARVELCFSLRKQVKNANDSKAMIDMLMFYLQNTVHFYRNDRRDIASDSQHDETKQQLIMLSAQLLEEMKRYRWYRMSSITARRNFSGELRLSAKDDDVALRHAAMLEAKRLASSRTARTEEQWREKLAELGKQKPEHQIRQSQISALTDRDRRVAVMLESKVVGQVNRQSKFWNGLAARKLDDELTLAFPYLVARGLLIRKTANKLRQRLAKLTKSAKAEVAQLFLSTFVAPLKLSDTSDYGYRTGSGAVSYPPMCKRCGFRHSGGVACFLLQPRQAGEIERESAKRKAEWGLVEAMFFMRTHNATSAAAEVAATRAG